MRGLKSYNEIFIEGIKEILNNEGGYVNDPSDMGGETKFGISKRTYPNLDIKNLTKREAIQIYYEDFWKKGAFERINHPNIAIKLFDLTVNMGEKQANIILQRALRSINRKVDEDGVVGPKTLQAINSVECAFGLLAALKSEAAGFYRLIAQNNKNSKFLNGWLSRAYR